MSFDNVCKYLAEKYRLSRTCGDKRILSNKGRMPYTPTKTEFIPL